MGVCVGGVVSPSQPRPWRLRPSISEVQRGHLVGVGKLRGRNTCEPGWGSGGHGHYSRLTAASQGPRPHPRGHLEVTGGTRE